MHGFKDHFSGHAPTYAKFRPRYPARLFSYLASLAPGDELAWDCATGNGQAALGLAPHFKQVVATDASADQLAHAYPADRVTYRVARAEGSNLPDRSVDLLTVANAIHWFDFETFYAEARRVLKPGGVIAAWTYSDMEAGSSGIAKILSRYYRDLVGDYWPPERRLVEQGYRTIPFPFAEITPPGFEMKVRWNMEDFLGYLGTWSASRGYLAEKKEEPTDLIREELAGLWGDSAMEKEISWKLHLRVGKT